MSKSVKLWITISVLLLAIVLTLCAFFRLYKFDGSETLDYDLSGVALPRVVVSFTTIPTRVKYVRSVIEELKKQTLQPDAIYVNIPYYSKRLKVPYVWPEDAKLPPNVKVVRGEDYGPATKLLGAIREEKDPGTIVITIDDDHYYHPDTIKALVFYGTKFPDKVVSFRSLGPDLTPTSCVNQYQIVGPPRAFFAEGFSGVLYRRGFVSEEMINYFKEICDDCFVSDDLVISTWMEILGHERIKICDFSNSHINQEIDANNALHRENRWGVYPNCHRKMVELLFSKTNKSGNFIHPA